MGPTTSPTTHDDGEHETRVKVEFIKALDSSSSSTTGSSSKMPREGRRRRKPIISGRGKRSSGAADADLRASSELPWKIAAALSSSF